MNPTLAGSGGAAPSGQAGRPAVNRFRVAVAVGCGAGYVLLAAVLLATDLLRPLDAGASATVQRWAGDHPGTPVLRFVELGNGQLVAGLVTAVAVTAALARRCWRPLLASAVTLVLLLAVVEGFKLLVERASPTPDGRHSEVFFLRGGAAFPSGHTAGAVVGVYLVGTLLVGPTGVRPSRVGDLLLPAVTVVLGGGVGLLTVGLGWHWPTDVLGGALLAGSVCATGRVLLVGRAPIRRPTPVHGGATPAE